MAGLLQARLPELDLEGVPDPRAREGRWSLAQLLRATLVGIMAGCRSLSETEALTETLAPAMRRRLGLPRRLADTTARDALCRVPLSGLRAVLHRMVRAAWRRKAEDGRLLRRRGRSGRRAVANRLLQPSRHFRRALVLEHR